MLQGNFGLHDDPRSLRLKASDWTRELAFGSLPYEGIPVEGGIEEEVCDEIINIDQDAGYCTGAAVGYALEAMQYREHGRMVKISAVDLYNHNRTIDGLPAGTEGSTVWASVETARTVGAIYAYIIGNTAANMGSPKERTESEKKLGLYNRAVSYIRCENLNDILICLAHKYPVVFGMYVFQSYANAPNGMVPVLMNGYGMGGHEMCALRYNRETRRIIGPQSWGINPKYTDKRGFQQWPFEHFMPVQEGPMLTKQYLGDAYALLDFIPAGATALPKTLTVLPEVIRVRVNGVDMDLSTLQIPPFIASNIGKTFVYIRDLVPIVAAMLKAAGHNVTPAVEWNQKERAVEFKV